MDASLRTFVCLAVFLAGSLLRAQEAAPPAGTCILELTLPAGATVTVDRRDYGTQRTLTFQPLAAGKFYRSLVQIRFPSGQQAERYVLLEGGQRVKLALSDPGAGQPELMLQSNETRGGVAWSHDGRFVLAGRTLCDAATGKQLRSYPKPVRFPHSVAFSRNGSKVALGALFNPFDALYQDFDKVYVFETETGRLIRELSGVARGSADLAFSPDGRLIAVGGKESQVDPQTKKEVEWGAAKIFDLQTGSLIRAFKTGESVGAIAFSPDSRSLLTGEGGMLHQRTFGTPKTTMEVILWEISSGQRRQTFAEHTQPVEDVDISPDGRRILTASSDKTTIIWDATTGTKVRTFSGHLGAVAHAQFTNDGSKIFSCGNHGNYDKPLSQFILWDVNNGRKLRGVDNVPGRADSFVLGPDETQIACDLNHGAIVDLDTGKTVHALNLSCALIERFSVHVNRIVVQLTRPAGHDFLDLASGQVLSRLAGTQKDYPTAYYMSDSQGLAVTSDARYMATAAAERVVLREVSTGQEVRSLVGHRWKVTNDWGGANAAFSPDGLCLATSAKNPDHKVKEAEVLLWDVASGKQLHRLVGMEESCELVFSPDGRRLLTQSMRLTDNTLLTDAFLWDVATGHRIRTFPAEEFGPRGAAYSPDGRYIVTGSRANWKFAKDKGVAAIVWDAQSGLRLREFRTTSEMEDSLEGVSFSSDGRLLATIPSQFADRGKVRIWDWATGQLLRAVDNPDGAVRQIAFVPGSRLLVGKSFGRGLVWDVSTGERVCQVVPVGQDGDWIALSPHGLFDGTEKARQQVTFRVGGRLNVVPVERFFQDFYRPGLFAELLQAKRPLPTVAVGDRLAPAIKIVSPRPAAELKAATVTLEVEVTDRGGGVKGPWLKHNGAHLIVPGEPRRAGKLLQRTFQVALVEGENTFEVLAATEDGVVESEPARVTLSFQEATAESQFYLVAVGINAYAEETMKLNHAAADAQALARLFEQRGPALFGKERIHITQLVDQQATRDKIREALTAVAKAAGPQDTFCLFLAGHGTMVGQRYFFIPQEFKSSKDKLETDIAAQGLAGDELDNLVSRVPALKRVVIYDTCQSGGAIAGPRTARNPFQFRKALEQMSRSQGSFVIAATAATDDAQEVPELGHGVLTYALLAAAGEVEKGPLKRRKLPAGDDQLLKVRDWFNYAQDEVPGLTKVYFGSEQFVRFSGAGSNFALLPLGKP